MTSLDYPPGPHSILPNKSFRQFMCDPIKTFTDIANTYGNICHFKFGKTAYLKSLNNLEYIEGILNRDENIKIFYKK